jgi:isoleucyl-tRNA synthetase
MSYKQINTKGDLPALEREIQEFWKSNETYSKRVKLQEGRKLWSFIDGPITANNPMGVHHAWGRAYKDLWARYKFMRGYEVRNQNGFDCQGLWIEVEVEKELGFKSKRDIEKYGIAEFVKKCKQRVLEYSAIQTEQSIRLGMWTDWNDPIELRKLLKALDKPTEHTVYQGTHGPVYNTAEALVGNLGSREMGGSYFTLSDENNYMIWAVLKNLHQRGLIYKGTDSMPWCPRCSTGISQHEIVTEGYKELTHPSIYLKFPLRKKEGNLLIWTTTPWTLTSNVAVAVHPELDYVKVEYDNEILYLSKGTLGSVFPKGDYEILEELKGSAMKGWSYDGPYDEFELPRKLGVPKAHRVIFWEEVGETEGTGIVHIAPGAGKEDFELGIQYGLPVVAPLDEFGMFIEGLNWLTGTHVYDSADPIFHDLEKKGYMFRVEDYTHRYPVCWRCNNELVFRHVEEWFIDMGRVIDKPIDELTTQEKESNLRYQIMDSAHQTRWIPDFGLAREIDWLKNMHDWMISKKRYYGLALPIWICSDCGWYDVIGSKDELKKRAIEGWEIFEGHSPHRPFIDDVKIRCSECGNNATRIPDVGNPWLDAGIVAFSTLDYRTDREYWEKWFPAAFITECYIGQFRNWFYSMLAMSTILERRTPFEVCLGHGTVLAEDGREMHKSWGNAIWFDDAAETMGADPLLNVYNFFTIYAELDKWKPDQKPERLSSLDRWILSKLNVLIERVTDHLDDYNAYTASREIERFVDVLSRWFVRRSRRRFWKNEADDEKKAAYSTLYNCLKTLIHLMAPFTPHISEAIYHKMVLPVDSLAQESIHLNSWPDINRSLIDVELMAEMDLAILVSSLGRAARSKSGIKLRQPLLKAVVVSPDSTALSRLKRISPLIMEELNVKDLELTAERKSIESLSVKPLPHILGIKHGALYRRVADEIRAIDQIEAVQLAKGNNVTIFVDSPIEILAEEVEVQTMALDGYTIMNEGELMVGVVTTITEELKSEGLARDVVRRIQALRKEADFNIDDKIETYYESVNEIALVFSEHEEYIKIETLSIKLVEGKLPANAFQGEFDIDGKQLRLGLLQIKS